MMQLRRKYANPSIIPAASDITSETSAGMTVQAAMISLLLSAGHDSHYLHGVESSAQEVVSPSAVTHSQTPVSKPHANTVMLTASAIEFENVIKASKIKFILKTVSARRGTPLRP